MNDAIPTDASDIQRTLAWATLLNLIDVALIVAIILLPVVWLWDQIVFDLGFVHGRISWNWKPILAPVFLWGIRRGLAKHLQSRQPQIRGLWDLPVSPKLCFSILSVFVFFYLFEQVLVAIDFEATLPPIVIQGQDDGIKRSRAHIPDRELLWKFNPGAEFQGRPVNNLGFLDRPVDPVKKPGVVRVICMGDSCTGQGIPPYSGFLHHLLTNAPPDTQEWEAFNMGVHGYSSVQGLRSFQRQGKDLEPDFVTIFYGWNDHWLGHRPDSSRMAMAVPRGTQAIVQKLRFKRFFQWMVQQATRGQSTTRAKVGLGPRVPSDEYRWTLHAFARETRDAGAEPVFITAPRAETLAKLLLEKQARTMEEATRWHDEYVEITREVAREEDALLLDLAAMFEGTGGEGLFSGDGIHFTRDGRKRIARELYKVVAGTDEAPDVVLE